MSSVPALRFILRILIWVLIALLAYGACWMASVSSGVDTPHPF